MNERIKELAKLADAYAHNRMAEIGGSYLEYHNKKFAELIVRECAWAADFADGEPGDYILKHFGVEE